MQDWKKKLKWPILAVILILAILLPTFITKAYSLHTCILIGIYILLALALNIVTGYCGQLSVGHAAFYGIGAYTAALLSVNLGLPFILTFFAAAILSAFFGLLLGLPTLRLKGAYLVIATIGFGEIVRQILVNWISLTRGPMGITGIPYPNMVLGIDFSSKQNYYYLILLIVVITLILMYMVTRSRTGRAWIAIRENQIAAEVMGIHLAKYKLIAFVISAFVAGYAGALYVHYVNFVSPDSFVLAESITMVITVIVGGMGTLIGPIIGAISIHYLLEALRDIGQWRMVVYGLLLFFSAIYMPKGLMGVYNALRNRYKRKHHQGGELPPDDGELPPDDGGQPELQAETAEPEAALSEPSFPGDAALEAEKGGI